MFEEMDEDGSGTVSASEFLTQLRSYEINDFIIFILLSVGESGDLRNLTLIRVLRLFRMARVIKLLRHRLFKELKLMLRGLFFGLRTLGWALGLFLFVLYNIALMIR